MQIPLLLISYLKCAVWKNSIIIIL